jgi:hypothetical protein
MKKTLLFILITAFAASAFAQHSITSFSPLSGAKGTAVKISGTNFNTTAANNVVYFGGGVRAKVNVATSTYLNVTVPAGASFGHISVTDLTANRTAYSTGKFNVTFPYCGPVTTASFASPVTISTNHNINNTAAGDIDGDGKIDVVMFGGAISGDISVLRNTGSPGTISFAPEKMLFASTTYHNPHFAELSDLNGDGKPELIVANAGQDNLIIFKNNSSPGNIVLDSSSLYTTGDQPYVLTVKDIDLDGRPDLAVTTYRDSMVSIFRNTSSLWMISFASPISFRSGIDPYGVTLGDLDGDSKPDMVTSNLAPYPGTLSIFRNTSVPGTISFTPRAVTFGLHIYNICMGDMDGDGKLDLVTAQYPDTMVSVFRNTSTIGNISFAPRLSLMGKEASLYVSVNELDGDGKPDIVVTNTNGGHAKSVFSNKSTPGNLSFALKVDITGGSWTLATADIDGDGRCDIFENNTSDLLFFRNKYCSSAPCTNTSDFINEAYCNSYESPSMKYLWTQSGFYYDTIPNVAGCDSFITFNLTIDTVNSGVQQNGATLTADASGALYQWIDCKGNTILQGETNRTFTATSNGDFAVIIEENGCIETSDCFNVNSFCANSAATVNRSSCRHFESPSGKYSWANSGIYNDTIANAGGCDSIITFNLVIDTLNTAVAQNGKTLTALTNGAVYQWIDCSGHTVLQGETGQTFTAVSNGLYAVILQKGSCKDTSSCYSVTSVCTNTASSVNSASCFGFKSPSGKHTWTKSGIYPDTIPNAGGCDSIITFNLTIDTVNIGVIQTGQVLSASVSGAAYQWINCIDDSIIQGATGRIFFPNANGWYAVIVQQNNCIDTSACFNVSGVGTTENVHPSGIEIFPNPATREITILTDPNMIFSGFRVLNTAGQTLIESAQAADGRFNLDISDLCPGLYLLEIKSIDIISRVKFMKY